MMSPIEERVVWEQVGGQWVLAVDLEEPDPTAPLAALVERAARAVAQEGDGRVLLLVNAGADTLPDPVAAHLASGSVTSLLPQVERMAHVGLVSERRRAMLDRLIERRGAGFVGCFGTRQEGLAWLRGEATASHGEPRCEPHGHPT